MLKMKNFTAHKGLPENRAIVLTALDCHDNPYLDDKIREAVKGIKDWNYVAFHLVHHGTAGMFARHGARLGLENNIDENFLREIRLRDKLFRFRNARYYKEMSRISSLFEKNRVSMTFVKGAQLVAAGLIEPENRFMNDIDCIVPIEEAGKARELLLGGGYAEQGENDFDCRYDLKGEMRFINIEDREISVDINILLNKNRELLHCYPLKTEDMLSRLTWKAGKGLSYNEIENEFHFIYCLYHHAALNYFWRLNWLNDLYIMFKKANIERLFSYASRYKLGRVLDLFLDILSAHYDINTPRKSKGINIGLRRLYLDPSCSFADLETIDRNESVRIFMIDRVLDRIIFLIMKVFSSPETLRIYYNLNPSSGIFYVYGVHVKNLFKRIITKR